MLAWGGVKLRPGAASWGEKMQNSWADLKKGGAVNNSGMKEGRYSWATVEPADCGSWISDQRFCRWKMQLWLEAQLRLLKHASFAWTFGETSRTLDLVAEHTHKTIWAGAVYDLSRSSTCVHIVSIVTYLTDWPRLFAFCLPIKNYIMLDSLIWIWSGVCPKLIMICKDYSH